MKEGFYESNKVILVAAIVSLADLVLRVIVGKTGLYQWLARNCEAAGILH